MLPGLTIPAGLVTLLQVFRPCFTTPTFHTFCGLVLGSIAATGRRTVCAMLLGAGLSRVWPHDRAHDFFARSRWDPLQVGSTLARLVVEVLVPAGEPVVTAVDDTLFKRWGPKVFGRAWQHDGAGKGPRAVSSGVCFVVVGIVVTLPFCSHPVCLPVLARLWRPAPKPATGSRTPARRSATATTAVAVQRAQTRLDKAVAKRQARADRLAAAGGWLPGSVPDLDTPIARARQALAEALAAHTRAQALLAPPIHCRQRRQRGTPTADSHPTKTEIGIDLVTRLAAALPGRAIHVVADAAYHSPALRHLPEQVTWTFRLAKTAVLHALPPAPTGGPGRPPVKGHRLGTCEQITATAAFTAVRMRRNGTDTPASIATLTCLWHSSLGTTRIRLTLIRNHHTTSGYDLAILTTDHTSSPITIANRYATRWSIEVCFHEARDHLGTGQPHNRTRTAVERTIPFQLATYSLVTLWYARYGHHPTDVINRRLLAPWYTTKTSPSYEDMITKLRRDMTISEYQPRTPEQALPQQIPVTCPTCQAAAA